MKQLRVKAGQIAIALILCLTLANHASAGILDAFEMEGDAKDDAPVQNDAENIYDDTIGPPTYNTTVFFNDFVDANFIADGTPADASDDIFTGGGSKDTQDITNWQYSDGAVPDKNQLMNGMAAIYVDPTTGHPMLYVGVDRYVSNGAASMGFWLFGQNVIKNPVGSNFLNSNTGLPATHAIGDVLLIVNYPQDTGSAPQLSVYTWEATGLTLVTTGTSSCGPATAGSPFCASTNPITYPAPWPFLNKNGNANHEANLFLEASVDLEALLGPNLGCFNSFMTESRATASATSTLKDFTLGDLKGCDLTITKSGTELSKEGDVVTYSFEITNPAVVPLTAVSLIDDELGDITAELVADGCSEIKGQGSCTVDVDWTVPAGYFTTNNPTTNTAVLTYAPPNGESTTDTVVTDAHVLELFSPALSMTKSAPTEAFAGDTVTYTFTLTNDSQDGPTLPAPDLVLETEFSTPPSVTGQEYETISGVYTFTGIDVFVGDATATEGGNLAFDVLLSSAATADTTVTVSTTDGSASSGSDYTGGPYVLVIPAGEVTGQITIPSLTDIDTSELEETFTVNIDSVVATGNTFDDFTDTGTGFVLDGFVEDDVLGLLSSAATAAGCDVIATGASCQFTVDWPVASSPDPLINTVNALYHPDGYPNQITATDTHSLDVQLPAIVNGTVWLDVDGDGVQDTGEPGVAGVTVYLCAAGVAPCDSGSALATVVTDANGDYSFPGLFAGDYQVQVEPGELIPGEELGGLDETVGNIAGNTGDFTLPEGESSVVSLGYIPISGTAVVDGAVWSDASNDGVQNPDEVGIEGVTVQLFNTDGSPALDSSNNPITAVTGPDGSYLLTGVQEGEYVVSPILTDPELVAFCSPDAVADCNTTPTTSDPFTVLAGDIVADVDFGFDTSSTFVVQDAIWYDADGDGVQDADEGGIAGVTLDLLDSAGNIIATVVTDANGEFSFTGIPEGDYTIEITDAAGILTGRGETTATGGSAAITLNDTTTGGNGILDTVGDDGTATFGYNQPNLIGGTVWSDANADGILDEGEAGIAGVPIYLCTDPASPCDPASPNFVAQTTTNADGSYEFIELPADDYIVAVGSLPGGTQTGDPDEPAVCSICDSQATITLVDGESVPGISFGYNDATLDDISGTVFLDVDSDGTREPDGNDGDPLTTGDNETGLGGVTIDLIDSNGDVVATTLTNPDGSYTFVDVPDGDYTVAVTDTDNTLDGFQLTSGLDALAVTADSTVAGNPEPRDFGYVDQLQTAAITTGLWIDADQDGIKDPGETPISGVTVNLYEDVNGDGLLEANLEIITDAVDLNGDGVIDASDTGPILGTGLTAVDGGIDTNGDGVIDATDDATGVVINGVTYDIIDGVLVDSGTINPVATGTLLGADGDPIASAETDANGDLIFPDLAAGNYLLDVDETDPDFPPNLDETSYPGPIPSSPIALSDGETFSTDFGYLPLAGTASISGSVWSDANADGTQAASDVGLGGITVILYDQLGNVVATTTTAADGSYQFTGLDPCDPALSSCYAISYDAASVDALGLDGSEPTNTPDTDGDSVNDDVYHIFIEANEFASGHDFGFAPSDPASLGVIDGTVYYEPASATPNGAFDGIDEGIEAVTINLVDSAGNVVATTTTSDGSTDVDGDGIVDPVGFYSFTGIVPGDYSVVVTDLNNATLNFNQSGDPDETGGLCTVCDESATITVAGGVTETASFGYIGEQNLGNVGSLIWLDVDNDGLFDPSVGDVGLAGVTVECWLDVDNSKTLIIDGVDNLIRTVTTDANGEYFCEGLPTAGYLVRVTDTAGVLDGSVAATVPASAGTDGIPGTLDDVDQANKLALTIPVAPVAAGPEPVFWYIETMGDNLTADFAVTGNNTISGNVFEETAGTTPDAIFDGTNDAGVEGVMVTLLVLQANGSYVALMSTTTAADGSYTFASLPDGEYQVVVDTAGSTIDGFGQTADPDLGAGVLCDSGNNCDSTAGTTTPISVSGGTPLTDVDFGYQSAFITTPVTVNVFSATSVGNGVEFNWETSNEVGHLGYQIYARAANGWVLLTPDLIINKDGGDPMAIRRYSYTAFNVDAKWFALVDVSVTEELTPHGPFKVGETYGKAMVKPAAFDWSKIQLETPSKARISESVQGRLKRLLELDRGSGSSNENPVNHGGDE